MPFVKEAGQPYKFKFSPYTAGSQDEPHSDEKPNGPAHKVTTVNDHQHGKHSVTAEFVNGQTSHEDYATAKESRAAAEQFEQGGEDANTDVKRRTHPDQQGAESSEDGFEMPDLA
jgi:hypothetical protein